MKKYLILLIILTTSSVAYSQACGGGTFIFEFYILNGENQENLYYEILDFDSDLFKKDNKEIDQATYAKFVRNHENGIMIDSSMVNEIDNKNEALVKFLAKRKIDKRGLIDNGVIKFKTIETYNNPYILKVTSSKVTFHILANLFGGCNRTTKVLLQDIPEIVVEKN